MSDVRPLSEILDEILGDGVPDEYPDECQHCGAAADPFWIPNDWTPADGAGVCTECGEPFGSPRGDE